MGTNYYVKTNIVDIGVLHLGKSSYGWTFALHIYPEYNISTLNDWKRILYSNQIFDEYNRQISYMEMLDIITKRETNSHNSYLKDCELGPNNLVRPLIKKNFCIGHGVNEDGSQGTWSYMIHDFR